MSDSLSDFFPPPVDWLAAASQPDSALRRDPPLRLQGKDRRRFLLLSDVHANEPALRAVMEDADGKWDAAWFLGDIAGYGPHPAPCIRFLIDVLAPSGRWVAGNHDLGLMLDMRLGRVLTNYRPGSEVSVAWRLNMGMMKSFPDLLAWMNRRFVARRIQPQERAYAGCRQVFVHGSPADPVGHYPFPDDRSNHDKHLRDLWQKTPAVPAAWLIYGHTHMPLLARLKPGDNEARLLGFRYGEPQDIGDGAYVINPGSVGQPRDGDPRAAYAILNPAERTITYHRAKYYREDTLRDMRRLQYPEKFIDYLENHRTEKTVKFESMYERLPNGAGVKLQPWLENQD